MGFLNKVGSFLKREAKDLSDAAEGAKDQLDEELARREAELSMSPAEKISAIQRDAAETDARFEAIAERASGRGTRAGAAREVAEIDPNVQLPNVTHIVLPDGRVKSGNDVPAFDEASSVPTVTAPTTGTASGPANLPPPRPPANLDPTPEQAPSSLPHPGPSAEADRTAEPQSSPEPHQSAAAAEIPLPPAAAPSPAAAQLPPPPANVPPAAAAQLPPPPANVASPAAAQLPAPPATAAATELASPQTTTPAPDVAAGASLPARLPSPRPPANVESPDYGKTPAQIKYERARAAANELLDELRGELKNEGEI